MMSITPENKINQEILRKTWPQDIKDSSLLEDDNWDILNETNSPDVLKRHWFKQNYINQFPKIGSVTTYH